MKKIIYVMLFCLFNSLGYGQKTKLTTQKGLVAFEASVKTFEEIKASLNNGVCVVNIQTGDLASVLLIKSFKFKNSLMQEHFNENYMESDKFPKAILKGKIIDFVLAKLAETPTQYNFKGSIEIHGVVKEISFPVKLYKKAEKLYVENSFSLKPEDFKIEIPSIVGYKIAKSINVETKFNLDF